MNKIQKFMPHCLLVVALIVIGAINIWAPICDSYLELANGNMTYMRCTYTAKIAMLLAIIIIILAIFSIISKKSIALPAALIGIALFLITIESSVGIGICSGDDMACIKTALWLKGSGIAIIIISIISIYKPNPMKR